MGRFRESLVDLRYMGSDLVAFGHEFSKVQPFLHSLQRQCIIGSIPYLALAHQLLCLCVGFIDTQIRIDRPHCFQHLRAAILPYRAKHLPCHQLQLPLRGIRVRAGHAIALFGLPTDSLGSRADKPHI